MSDEEKKEVEDTEKNTPEEVIKEEVIEEEASPEVNEVTEEPKELPHRDLKTGMVVKVHEKIKDISPKGEKRERVQIFEGVIIGFKSKGIARTMTVRKDSKGWMVEKIFPLSSPNIEKIEIVKQYRVRRAKLSYLRGDFKRKLKEIRKEDK